jgi:hypothetical protein
MEFKNIKNIDELLKIAQDLGQTEYVLRTDPKTRAETPIRKKQKDPFLAKTPKPSVPEAKV